MFTLFFLLFKSLDNGYCRPCRYESLCPTPSLYYSTPSVLSCARHLLWRVSLFLRSLARHLMPASRMFILRHYMPREKR